MLKLVDAIAWSTWTAEQGPLDATLLGAHKRRATRLARMAAHVLQAVRAQVRFEVATIPIVYATAYGEMDVTAGLLGMMHEDDGSLSPMRFANSVHNAGAGYLSIACENRGLSTTISAGDDTVAMGLMEAFAIIASGSSPVGLVVVEEPIPAPIPAAGYGAVAAAFLLGRASGRGPKMSSIARAPAEGAGAAYRLPAAVAANPCASVLRLAHALTSKEAAAIALGPVQGWTVTVSP